LGSQEIILTTEGFCTADEAIIKQTIDAIQGFSSKIIDAVNIATTAYTGFGWECVYYPHQNFFLVNIPIAQTTGTGTAISEQYIVNATTGAWSRFTGWNALCFVVHNTRLYFGTDSGAIVLADTDSNDTTYGWGDNGVAVLRDCTQAYVRLSNPGMKSKITGVQIVSNCQRPTRASVNFFQDYGARALPFVPQADSFSTSYWDGSNWDTFYWGDPTIDPTNMNAKPVLYSVSGYGFAVALSYRLNYKLYPVVWYSTNYLFMQAGI
jgi:hypothetical protein